MKKCILYARFSPRPGAASCESCAHQLADLREFCRRRGWKVIGEFSDPDCHGDDHERPELRNAIAALKRGVILLCRDWDRLYRDTYGLTGLALAVIGRGAKLWSMNDGQYEPEDEDNVLMFEVKAAIARHRKAKIRKATSAGMRRNQAAGWLMGSVPPFGYREGPPVEKVDREGHKTVKRTLVPDSAEQPIVAEIVQLHAGGLTLRGIGRDLKARGISHRGNGWNHETIKAILRRAGC